MPARKTLLSLSAAAAVIGLGGCFPIVSNEAASQQDLIGDVAVSADACEASYLTFVAGIIGDISNPREAARRAARGPGPGSEAELFSCPERDQLVEVLEGGDEEAAMVSAPHQMLVGYRVPAGAKAPESFTATAEVGRSGEIYVNRDGRVRGRRPTYEPVIGEKTITFRRAAGLDAQIAPNYAWLIDGLGGGEFEAPALVGDGQKAVGYISDTIEGAVLGSFKLSATFGLPAGDQPTGSFNALTLLGSRLAIDDDDVHLPIRKARADEPENPFRSDRPISCLSTDVETGLPTRGLNDIYDVLSSALCPMPGMWDELVETETPTVEQRGGGSDDDRFGEIRDIVSRNIKGVDVPVRDLRVIGGEGFGEPGTSVAVPFTFRTTGAASGTPLALTAGTALGNATATPVAATTAFPAAGDTAKPVTVAVPADAAPGTYAVTLTAKVGGQTRTGTGNVVVLPKSAKASKGRDNVYMDAEGNIAFGWVCPPACGDDQVDVTAPKAGIAPKANTAAVSKPRLLRIARGNFSASTGKRVRVKVKLFKRAQRAVKRGRSVKAIIVVREGGKGTPQVRRVVIKRKKRK